MIEVQQLQHFWIGNLALGPHFWLCVIRLTIAGFKGLGFVGHRNTIASRTRVAPKPAFADFNHPT